MGSSHIYYNCVNFLQKVLQKAFLSIFSKVKINHYTWYEDEKNNYDIFNFEPPLKESPFWFPLSKEQYSFDRRPNIAASLNCTFFRLF